MNPSSQSLLSLTPKAEFGCAKWVREVDSKGERGSLASLGSLTERREREERLLAEGGGERKSFCHVWI